jgi:threonyl-tRNA synthetase
MFLLILKGEYAKNIFNKLKENNFRIELEDSKDGLGKKVRYVKEMKYPYWIVIGDKEKEENKVTLESRSGEKFNLSLEELIEKLREEEKNKI